MAAAAAPDAKWKGDMRKLARYFEFLAASEQGVYTPGDSMSEYSGLRSGGGKFTERNVKHVVTGSGKIVTFFPANMRSEFGLPVAGGDAASTEKGLCVFCDKCSKEHPRSSCCPIPCKICFKVHHPSWCPYFDHLPQGAPFADGYETFCVCTGFFNEEKWVCVLCGASEPVLKMKYCSICRRSGRHGSYECPEDKALAAEYKCARDKFLSGTNEKIDTCRVSSSS